MLVITSSSKVATAVSAATPIALNESTIAQLFYASGDARATEFSREFIKTNAQVLLNCNNTQKWYMRYTTNDMPTTDVCFLAITHKNKVSKGRIKTTTRSIDHYNDNIEEIDAVDTAEIA